MKKLFSCLLIVTPVWLIAQPAFVNNGNLQVHSGGSLTGYGDFTNSSAATLVNNGSLYLKAGITNNQASMNAGSGTLYIIGTGAQSISGTDTLKTSNLVTDNTAGIALYNNLSVSGSHTYTNGIITTPGTALGATTYLVYQQGATHTGSNDSRHVNGWIKKNGSGNFTFPVGSASYLRPITISSLSGVAEFNCHYYQPTQNIYNLYSPLVQVKVNEYWQLDKISGGTAQVTINWEHAKVPMDNVLVADILAAYYTSGRWTSAGGTASGTVTTTGSVTSAAMSSFGQVTIGYKSFPVPLKLISFTAERRSGVSYLSWITENEENVDHFEIERSYNASAYHVIGSVSARNSGNRQVYFFEDHTALNGIAYYRVKMVDKNGTYSYSRIVAVSENNDLVNDFYAINPARSAITVFGRNGNEGNTDYRLFTLSGQLLLKGKLAVTGSGSVIMLPPVIASGLYLLELGTGSSAVRQKILIGK